MKIFYQDDIDYFNNYWDQYINTDRARIHEKYHRLHDVIELAPFTNDKTFQNKLKPLEEISGLRIRNSYMLEYKKGSYAEMHCDDGAELTSTTLIYKSSNLDGGEILTSKNEKIKINKLKLGESIFYDRNVNHGISEVIEGVRRVLIVWMKK